MLCYAAEIAGTYTYTWPAGERALHHGVTVAVGRRRAFNGKLRVLPPGHPTWSWPLRWKGAAHHCLGPGMPSLIFVGDMANLFIEGRPGADIDRTLATIAASQHIGLILTKRTRRMAEYMLARSPRTVRRWQPRMMLGFSAERQQEFDRRWADVRPLAAAGWFTFVSIAPMIGPVTLPSDFLALGPRTWCIVAGEQGPHALCRPMRANWARAIRDQCAVAEVPYFLKQMARGAPIPPDLQIRQFPAVVERGVP